MFRNCAVFRKILLSRWQLILCVNYGMNNSKSLVSSRKSCWSIVPSQGFDWWAFVQAPRFKKSYFKGTITINFFYWPWAKRIDLLIKSRTISRVSGCARETFCGKAANSLAGFAREFLLAAKPRTKLTRLLPIFLTTCAAFCTRVRDRSSRGQPLPQATQANGNTPVKFMGGRWSDNVVLNWISMIFSTVLNSKVDPVPALSRFFLWGAAMIPSIGQSLFTIFWLMSIRV